MNEVAYKRNVTIYRLYAMFSEPLFWGPILIMALQELAHMPLTDIYYMESFVLIVCVLLDIPMGALADVIGRKKTLIIGRVFLSLSMYFFATMSNSLEAWIGNILWAIGYTMQSGADTSFLYDTLKEQGREGEYRSIEGKSIGGRFFLFAFCSLLVGVLAKVDIRLPLYLSACFVFIPLISAFFIKEPAQAVHYSMKKQILTLR